MEAVNSKRIARKHIKHVKVFERCADVECSAEPTKNIAICNAGLVNGLSYEDVFNNFSKFGPIDHIHMVPQRSFAFLSFQDVQAAVVAYKTCNGRLNLAQDGKPLYLVFVQDVPERFTYQENMNPPHGLIILPDFVTDSEEEILLNAINFDENSVALKHRQVKHFGFEFVYENQRVDKDRPLKEAIPKECSFLWDRLKSRDIPFQQPDQLTVNCYEAGQGIASHVDTHSSFTDSIIIVSLGSDVVMDFRNHQKEQRSVLIPRRSLTVLSGEARYSWCHVITPRKTDMVATDSGITVRQRGRRVSFTFRKVRVGECDCNYPEMCDTYHENMRKIDRIDAQQVEQTYVFDVYDTIANHFSDTRHKMWPKVAEFVAAFDVGSVLVDVGCGNGKYLKEADKIYGLGCDSSIPLLEVCRERGLEVFAGNCLRLPLRDDCADGVICIAVLHHLATEKRRLNALKEIMRILNDNGKALIYVWAKNQHKDKVKSSYLKQDRKNRKDKTNIDEIVAERRNVNDELSLPIHTNRKDFQYQDILVPWKLKQSSCSEKKEFLRFYHVFEEGELESLCRSYYKIEVAHSYYDEGNWCVILKKRHIL